MRRRALPSDLARRAFGPMPFARQVQTHVLSNAADAFFAVSLAGSLFFNVSLDAARPRILLYLALTMAPFAVVAPVIGPLIDRVPGGQRLVVSLTGLARAAVCVVMAGHLKTLFFYPEAFTILVLGKTYSVAKSALVPRIVTEQAGLVEANSRLSRLGTVGGALGGATAAGLLDLVGAPWTLRCGALVYAASGLLALRLPRPLPATRVSRARERSVAHAPRVVLAASAMAVLRGGVGFTMFLLALALRSAGEPAWVYGAVLAAGGAGGFLGTFLAPRLRRRWREVPMLTVALASPAALGLVAAAWYGLASVVVAVLVLGAGANIGRQAFDSLVQHHAADADRGRVFARFETRFQLAWALGAFLAVVSQPPPWLGMLLAGAVLAAGAVSLVAGTLAEERRAPPAARPRVRDLLDVDDRAPVGVRLLLTAEVLADDDLHDQAVLVAAAALDACPAVDGTGRATMARLRARAVDASASVSAGDAATAIGLAAAALARAREVEDRAAGDYPSGRRPTTSHPSPTRSTS